MSETADGYLPDYDIQWGFSFVDEFNCEVETFTSGREQRRLRTSGSYRRWSMASGPREQAERQTLYDFLRARQGRLKAFYFWRRDPAKFVAYSLGTLSSAASVVIPFKEVTVSAARVSAASIPFTVTENIGAGGEARLNFTSVASVTVTAGGSGYTSPPTVTFSSAPVGGRTATGTAVITGAAVTAVTITDAGEGYSSAPTVSFSGGGGTGAAATASLARSGAAEIDVTVGRERVLVRNLRDSIDQSFVENAATVEAIFVLELKEVK